MEKIKIEHIHDIMYTGWIIWKETKRQLCIDITGQTRLMNYIDLLHGTYSITYQHINHAPFSKYGFIKKNIPLMPSEMAAKE